MTEPKKKQHFLERVLWFVVGGAMSSGLNTGVMRLICDQWHWPKADALAISIPITAVVFFMWNYFVNFRTSKVWKNCLGRYLATVTTCQFVNYLISIACIGIWGTNWTKIYFINVGVMSFTGGIKFLLYHFWVFPPAEQPLPTPLASSPSA